MVVKAPAVHQLRHGIPHSCTLQLVNHFLQLHPGSGIFQHHADAAYQIAQQGQIHDNIGVFNSDIANDPILEVHGYKENGAAAFHLIIVIGQQIQPAEIIRLLQNVIPAAHQSADGVGEALHRIGAGTGHAKQLPVEVITHAEPALSSPELLCHFPQSVYNALRRFLRRNGFHRAVDPFQIMLHLLQLLVQFFLDLTVYRTGKGCAATGFLEVGNTTHMILSRGLLLPCQYLRQTLHCQSACGIQIRLRRSDGRTEVQRLADPIQPGYTYILRHPESKLLQCPDCADRHFIVGAYERLRHFPLLAVVPENRPVRRLIPEAADQFPAWLYRNAAFPQHPLICLPADPGNRIFLLPAQVVDLSKAMSLYKMAGHHFHRIVIIDGDVAAILLRSVHAHYRQTLLLGTVLQTLHQLRILQRDIKQDQSVKLGEVHQLINASVPFPALLSAPFVRKGIKHIQLKIMTVTGFGDAFEQGRLILVPQSPDACCDTYTAF